MSRRQRKPKRSKLERAYRKVQDKMIALRKRVSAVEDAMYDAEAALDDFAYAAEDQTGELWSVE